MEGMLNFKSNPELDIELKKKLLFTELESNIRALVEIGMHHYGIKGRFVIEEAQVIHKVIHK